MRSDSFEMRMSYSVNAEKILSLRGGVTSAEEILRNMLRPYKKWKNYYVEIRSNYSAEGLIRLIRSFYSVKVEWTPRKNLVRKN